MQTGILMVSIRNKLAQLTIRLESTYLLVAASFLVATCGYLFAVVPMRAVSLSTKVSFAAYVPFIVPGVFIYLYFGRWIIKRSQTLFSIRYVLLGFYWIVGACLSYALCLLGCFFLFFLARLEFLSWVPVGLRIHEFCVFSAILAALFFGAADFHKSKCTSQKWGQTPLI
jgi:hypothetical protein